MYIVIVRQTVSLNHNSSVCLDMQDASSWDQNPADFTPVFMYIYIYIDTSNYPHRNMYHTSK